MRGTTVTVLAVALAMTAVGAVGTEPVVHPYESEAAADWSGAVDALVLASLRAHGITPARRCSDEVFVRRAYLDVIGTLPEPKEVTAFLADPDSDKRAKLVDALLARPEFADYWALKWCDLLRVKAEFPINLWPNAVQAYHRWIRDALRRNMPYDRFARELLTSSGSNFRVPQVNFYRAVQGREPSALAAAVALTFMGTRVEAWTPDRRAGMEAFFSRLTYKKTEEWKEEIVLLDPAPAGPLWAELPDGRAVTVPAGQDPRPVFADWLTSPDNPWFARAVCNRVWSWLLGRGLVEEVDDMRPDNPPVNPELLAYLSSELVHSGFDLRHLYRLILTSDTYQQSPIPRGDSPDAETLFACYPVRRLDAEVLIDALSWVFGAGEGYESRIPEPFTFVPASQRTILLADGSTSSPFLELFGRPARDTGLESERDNQPTQAQRLHLLNSTEVQTMIDRSPKLAELLRAARGDAHQALEAMYLRILSRPPTADEVAAASEYGGWSGVGPRQAATDLAWALINSKEFLYRH